MMKPWILLWALALPACLRAAPTSADAGSPRAQFNNDSYQLGYDVFLKSGDLNAAFKVADKALQARPDDRAWLKSYARVAEWTGHPMEALSAWVKLARLSDSQEAWDAVGRLAPSLLDDAALLAYQQRALEHQPTGNDSLIKSIRQTYERLGRMDDGLDFFQRLAARQPSQLLLESEATMAERCGRDDLALSLLKRLNQQYGPREEWLLRIASISYLQGNQEQAWKDLHASTAIMPSSATGFWQTYGQISAQLGHKEEAAKAYQTLVNSDKASESNLMEYVSLLEADNGLAAARMSETLFLSYGINSALINALYLYQREHHPLAAQALLKLPSPKQLASLEQDPEFLEQRGQLEWQQHKYELAHADFMHGLRMRPGSPRFLLDLVSLASERSDTSQLRELLPAYAHRASTEPTLWVAWANGWTLLGKPGLALPYQQTYCQHHPEDLLAQLTLADIFDRIGQEVVADQLRQRVLARADQSDEPTALRDSLLTLRLNRLTPDAGAMLLRNSLRPGADGRPDPVARDRALGWLLGRGDKDAARIWLAKAFHGDAPLWARVNLASREEGGALADAIENPGTTMPPETRTELQAALADQTNWRGLGETAAFDASTRDPDDEAAAERYSELASPHESWLALPVEALQEDSLDRYLSGLAWSVSTSSSWRLELAAQSIVQRSSRLDVLGKPPSGNREYLQATHDTGASKWSMGLTRTSLLADYASVGITQHFVLPSKTDLYWQAGYNADAPESAPLLAVGAKDMLLAGFNALLRQHWFVASSVQGDAFHDQNREPLGQGWSVNLEAGWRNAFRGVPQTLTLTGTHDSYRNDRRRLAPDLAAEIPEGTPATSAFFMPSSFNQIGLHWAFGELPSPGREYGWHFFGDLGPSYANTTGSGYDVTAGLHGSVLGRDRLQLELAQGKSGQNKGSVIKRASLTYQYFY